MQTLQDSITRLRYWQRDHGATCPNQLFVADVHIVGDAAERTEKQPPFIFPDPSAPNYHRLDRHPPVRR